MIRTFLNIAVLLLMVFTPSLCWSNKTVLDYPEFTFQKEDISPPESSFDDWKYVAEEADNVLKKMDANFPATIIWTKLQLDRYIKHKMMPSRGARGLALMHVGMHDALIKSKLQKTDHNITIMMAAAEILRYLFPQEEHGFERLAFTVAAKRFQTSIEDLPDDALKALALGKYIGAGLISYANNDGAHYGWNGLRLQWYGEGRYLGPGSWEPTSPYFYYPPEEPFAPTWKPWVLKDAAQFLPEAPPIYGSKQFVAALQEVLDINDSLTQEQKKIAEFWVDGHGSTTPAGHWNQIAIDYVLNKHDEKQWDELQVAQLFAHLNIAMADTFIAAWHSKYHYWTIRPVTAAQKILGRKYKPYILTPPFPSYVSGHAATSGAAAEVIGFYFPENMKQIKQLAEQAADSRLLGGIHFKFDNDQGLILGKQVAQWVISSYIQNNKRNF